MTPQPDDREPDDRALMERYRDGDASAFDALYARHKGPLYRYFLRQLDADNAADLFQEVWSRIIRSRATYRPSAKFTTYMYRIAHNCLVDHYRRSSRAPARESGSAGDPELQPANPGREPGAETARAQAGDRLLHALASLPDEQREAFLLREESGMSLAEIAQATGVGAETAKSRLRYAVRKLRTALAQERNES